MEKPVQLTPREQEVMQIFWDAGRPLMRSDFMDVSKETNFNTNNLNLIINQLIGKGLVQVDKIVKVGKSFGRVYSPTVSRETYLAIQMIDLQNEAPVNAIPKICASLIRYAETCGSSKKKTIKGIVSELADDDQYNETIVQDLLKEIDET